MNEAMRMKVKMTELQMQMKLVKGNAMEWNGVTYYASGGKKPTDPASDISIEWPSREDSANENA